MGAVTPLGNDVATFWQRLVAGESGVAHDHRLRPGAGHQQDRRRGQGLRSVERARSQGDPAQRPLHAVRARRGARGDGPGRACRSASRASLPSARARSSARGLGGTGTLIEQITINATRGPDRLSPFFIPMAIANMAAGPDGHQLRALGAPTGPPVSACATAGHAIGEANETIIRGDADMMIAGGSEAPGLRAARRRLCRDARALDAQRRSPGREPAVRRGPRRVRHRRGRRRARARRA